MLEFQELFIKVYSCCNIQQYENKWIDQIIKNIIKLWLAIVEIY